jgi:hypothetical protein
MNSMPELTQSALSALRHLQPADRTAAAAILSMWAHRDEIDIQRVVDYYFAGGPSTNASPDDSTEYGKGYADGYVAAVTAVKAIREEQRQCVCPDWCVLDHAQDDRRDDLVLHQGDDHTDGTVRKLLDPDRLDIRVSRTDCPAEGMLGTAALYVTTEVELTTWEQAAELARTILDGFGYLKGAERN